MHRYNSILLVTLLALTGCTVDRIRYESNLKHAYITPWTHLSPSDRDEIIRIVTAASEEPIVGITAHRRWNDGSTVSVFTGKTDQKVYKFWNGYLLKKDRGHWRITFHGEASPIVARLALSRQAHEMERRRQ